jgi:hypothetical protein
MFTERIICVWIGCFLIDTQLARKIPSDGVRWFAIHAIVNFVIAMLSLSAVIEFASRPLAACLVDGTESDHWSPRTKWPLILVVGLHTYHMFPGRFKLHAEDYFHHIVFIPTLALPGMVYDWGVTGNWLVFFICGIPGGVDYTILALQKMGLATRLNQKRISAYMNAWVRTPGVLMGVGITYALFVNGDCTPPTWVMVTQLVFMVLNVSYYSKQSAINYALHTARQFIPSDMDWKTLKRVCV